MNTIRSLRRLSLVLLAGTLTLAQSSARADHGNSQRQNRINRYQITKLVSDQPGEAMLQDPDLINAWGISFRAAGSPFWISDNGSGVTTLYAVTYGAHGMVSVAKAGLIVTIPGEGNPTGQLSNGTGLFNNDLFIFASEDGTISGWRGALGTAAEALVTRPAAVYKGITLADGMLLAANFSEGTVDVYDSSLSVRQFSDPHAPDGYAPFNVQVVAGKVFVTFAKQDDTKEDDVPGPGHGLIDIFDPLTGVFIRFATGSDAGGHLRQLNSPWGMALAPSSFGKHADQLLVGNFGDGTIMSFEADGDFKGLLRGAKDGPLRIDGLWALTVGGPPPAGRPSTVYFTAGPDDESHGLFGSLDPVNETEDDD